MTNNNTKKSEETWNAIAQSFDATRRKPWEQCIDFINLLSKDSVVADIACGNGRHLIPCAKHCKKVIGADFSKNLLDIVQKKLDENNITNVVLHHSDVANLSLETGSMDAVMFIAALHNIQGRDNRIQALKEVKRVLKKDDGIALISVWSRWQDKYCKQFFKKWFTQLGQGEFGDIDIYWRQHGLDIPRFYHLYSKKEFISDLKKAGLKIEYVEDVKLHSKKHADNYFALVR
jgi:alkylated DNA repair protein alkB family protein 8